MPDIVNYALLDAQNLCIPINILKLCVGTQIPWKSFTLSNLAFNICWAGPEKCSILIQLFPIMRQDLSLFSLQCLINQRFSSLAGGRITIPSPIWALSTATWNLTGWFFPSHQVVSSHACANLYLAKYSRGSLFRYCYVRKKKTLYWLKSVFFLVSVTCSWVLSWFIALCSFPP